MASAYIQAELFLPIILGSQGKEPGQRSTLLPPLWGSCLTPPASHCLAASLQTAPCRHHCQLPFNKDLL